MNKTHQCNCPNCGVTNAVELRQAGQTLSCSGCRKEFETPKLRELKQLPLSLPLGEQTTAIAGSSKRAGAGALFAIGLAMAIVAGVSGGTLYRYASNLTPSISADEYVALQNEAMDKAPINQLYARWEELFKDRNVPEWHESEVKSLFKQSGYLKTLAWGMLIVAGCGLLMTVYSLIPARRSNPAN